MQTKDTNRKTMLNLPNSEAIPFAKKCRQAHLRKMRNFSMSDRLNAGQCNGSSVKNSKNTCTTIERHENRTEWQVTFWT